MTVKKKYNLEKDKDLFEKVVAYEELNSQQKEIKDTLGKIKKEIIDYMKSIKLEKAKSQVYSVNLSHIIQKRLSEKKLKEELEARGLLEIYESCLYTSEYDRLSVSKRKGGENIF